MNGDAPRFVKGEKSIMGETKGAKSNLVKDGAVVATTNPLFGDVVLSLPEGEATAFASRRGNSVLTCPAIVVTVPLSRYDGLAIRSTIYANLSAEGEISILPSLPKGLNVGRDSDLRDAFRAHVNSAIAEWAEYEKAMTACEKAFEKGIKPKDEKAKTEKAKTEPIVWKRTKAATTDKAA